MKHLRGGHSAEGHIWNISEDTQQKDTCETSLRTPIRKTLWTRYVYEDTREENNCNTFMRTSKQRLLQRTPCRSTLLWRYPRHIPIIHYCENCIFLRVAWSMSKTSKYSANLWFYSSFVQLGSKHFFLAIGLLTAVKKKLFQHLEDTSFIIC